MGTLHHPLTVLSSAQDEEQEVEALVDTGSTYLWLPGSLLRRLGYRPVVTREFAVATGERIQRDVAPVIVRLNDETLPVLCVFGDEGSQALLGAMVLESFSLGVDPVNRRLVPVPALAMPALAAG